MKTRIYLLQIALAILACSAHGQGTIFIYDQQSQTNQSPGGGAPIQSQQPVGQSFTPSLTGVDFFQLEFIGGGSDSQVILNLWSGSLGGTFLGSTSNSLVTIPGGAFNYVTNFFFPATISMTPGTTYYIQPWVQSGNINLDIVASGLYNYSGGTAYFNGAPDSGIDFWFREGIIGVPEPSPSLLILLGIAGLALCRNAKRIFCQ